MLALRRHQLARLSGAGWSAILARAWDAPARDCLAHWAANGWPLVVTRQSAEGLAAGTIALGLPAPARWGRRRLALHVSRSALLYVDEFPLLADVRRQVPGSASAAVRDLVAALADCGAKARVYGSHGWQAITGLDHLRPGSDLDLWVGVDDEAHADAVAAALLSFQARSLRLDGELVFADGSAVSWREWADWRAARVRGVMVRRLTGVALRRDESLAVAA